jgi:lipopolysaccharide/colanic/teichoic acid biosynthesis glycosyltransferase
MTPAVDAQVALKKPSALRTASTDSQVTPPPTRSLTPSKRLLVHAPAPRNLPRAERRSTARHLASTGAVPSWKRVLDIVCILLSLPVTLPSMVGVALWIKLVSNGPVLFRQERIGRNGRRFTLYKFRSMKANAPTQRHERHFRQLVESDCPMVKLDLLSDTRVIKGGCFLRAAGLDELPQLINVLRGEMSLVGPRPCLPEEYCFFSTRQRERFEVLPGLTGIWQVVGKGSASFSEMNAMDVLYVRRSSFGLDLSVIFRTPFALLRQMIQAYKACHKPAAKVKYMPPAEPSLSGYSTQRLG